MRKRREAGSAYRVSLMKTALCLCPDAAYFRPAIYAITSLVEAGDAEAFDIFVVCENADVAPGFERLDPALRRRFHLLPVDFRPLVGELRGQGRFPGSVFRRLFLDALIPERYERIVYLDSDMRIARAGLSELTTLDFGGKPFAAALDMIYLLDFRLDALARRFRRHRLALGLDLSTPYLNSGLLTIDRAQWRTREVTARIVATVLETPERFAFPEQDALNHLFANDFAVLSPRFNFMGDFFLLDLESTLRPIVLHFVNQPKPWNYATFAGERRFAEDYRRWFAASAWPDWASAAPAEFGRRKPALTAKRRAFAERLTEFLDKQSFVDR